MKLSDLIREWIDSSKDLRSHFAVVVVPGEFHEADSFHKKHKRAPAWISYRCGNTSAFRQSVRVDVLFEIFETYVSDSSMKIEAGDPNLIKKLESNLRRKHDRTGQFSMITFRDDCPVKLRDCGCEKAFCGC